MDMLSRSVFLDRPITNMQVGEQLKFNHIECSAGRDERHRLYILRKSSKMWIGYCHNCGLAGVFFAGKNEGVSTPDLQQMLRDTLEGREEKELPEQLVLTKSDDADFLSTCTEDPRKVDAWVHERLLKHYTNYERVVRSPYSWVYNQSNKQLVIPIFDDVGYIHGYQSRLAPGERPKCITNYFKGSEGHPLIYVNTEPVFQTIIIVEDPLSATRLHAERGHSVVALLGTHLSDLACNKILSMVNNRDVKHIHIWMDADTAGKEASVKIWKRLAPMIYVPITLSKEEEPKNIKDLRKVVI